MLCCPLSQLQQCWWSVWRCDCSTHIDTLCCVVRCHSSGSAGGQCGGVTVVHTLIHCVVLCHSSSGAGGQCGGVIVVHRLIHCVVLCHSSGSAGGQCGGVSVVHIYTLCCVLSQLWQCWWSVRRCVCSTHIDTLCCVLSQLRQCLWSVWRCDCSTHIDTLCCVLSQLRQCWWSAWRVLQAAWTQHCCSGSATPLASMSGPCPLLTSVLLPSTCLWLRPPPRCRLGDPTVSHPATDTPVLQPPSNRHPPVFLQLPSNRHTCPPSASTHSHSFCNSLTLMKIFSQSKILNQ